MRQGGLKPKGHSSGVYWTRAHTGGGKRKQKKESNPKEEINPNVAYDSNGDGKADIIGWILHAPVPECPNWIARGIVIFLIVFICLKYS
jgi:hypothetical protein